MLSCIHKGSGQSNEQLVVVGYHLIAEHAQRNLLSALVDTFDIYSVTEELPQASEVLDYSERLSNEIASARFKRMTLAGIDAGSSVVQALAAFYPKMIRRLILINACTRVTPNYFTRTIDKLERYLPLGLPLRPLSADFDSRPFLHKIRCPTLIVLTQDATSFNSEQATYLAQHIPNAWLYKTSNSLESLFSGEFLTLINKYLSIPAKRPQKSEVINANGQ